MPNDFDDNDVFPDALSQFLEGWVINRCYFCDPVRMVSREAALTMFPPTSVPMYINQPSCPFMHVKIGDKLYKRKLETSKNCDFWNELPRYCRYCGILFGNIHHISCAIECCPKCGEQFVCCDCHDRFKIQHYFLPGDKKGLRIPEALPMKVFERRLYAHDREAGLTTFIEHRLENPKFMQHHTLDQLKELALEFDKHREGFEEIWTSSLEFRERSRKALEQYNQNLKRFPGHHQKIRPRKWTMSDRVALK